MMSKKLVSVLQYVLVFGLGIFLIWWQLHAFGEEQKSAFKSALKYANYWLIIPIVIMSLASHFSRALRWKLLMEPLGFDPKTSNTFLVIMIGYLANSAVPRLGEVLKCTFLARYEKLPVDKLVGTMVVERAFDVICYAFFIGLTLVIQVDVIGDFFWSMVKPLFSGSLFQTGIKLGLLIVGLVAFYFFLRYIFRKYPENKFIQKIHAFYDHLVEGFKSIKNLKHRRSFIIHTVFIWSMYLLQIYIGFFAMDATSGLGIKAAFSVLTLVTLSMIVTPGGIGSFPIFVAKTLAIYGIVASQGTAFGWLMWGISTGFILIFGSISLFLIPFFNKEDNHEKRGIDTIENNGFA